ncbi:MAG: DUF4097 family beta strand repeat-containing protein [Lachnospiraceae bacterium]
MKKFVKGCLIAALVCGILGMCGCSAGFAMGAGQTAIQALASNEKIESIDRFTQHLIDLTEAAADLSENTDNIEDAADRLVEKYGKEYEDGVELKFAANEISKQTFAANEMQSIDVKDISGDIQILESEKADTAVVTVKAHNRKINVNTENGSLMIQDKGKKNVGQKSRVKIVLELPQQKYQTLNFDLSAGDLELDMDLSAEKLNLTANAGDITIGSKNGIEAAITLHALAGDVEFSGNYTGDISGKLSAGDFDMDGTLKGNLTLDCMAGDTELELKGNMKTYNYQLRSTCGDVTMNEKDYEKGVGGCYEEDNGASYLIKLDNSAGDIDLAVK